MQIKREELADFISQTHGRIFTAVFVKKDGTTRTMNCRKGVTAYLAGGENKAARDHKNLNIVFDMQARAYRMINLDTTILIKFKKEVYEVSDNG